MGIIEQAAKRLEELRRGGVEVPWEASGLSERHFDELIGKSAPTGQGISGTRVNAPAPAAQASAEPTRRSAQDESSPTVPVRRSRQVDIDLDALGRNGYLVPSMVRSRLALEFRHIKRPLLQYAMEQESGSDRRSLIMMTSAMPAEGKTFCSVNLAMSMAMEVDTSVLLVDADVVRPAVLDRLGLSPSPGLMDVLTNPQIDLADVIVRTNVPKLSLLPAGNPNAMATELLASGAMDRLLVEIATRYPDRVIILDAPPLLLSTEAQVLASRVGQVVVVVDSSRTTTSKVAEAFAALQGCHQVMSVLNKMVSRTQAEAYGYGYGYQ